MSKTATVTSMANVMVDCEQLKLALTKKGFTADDAGILTRGPVSLNCTAKQIRLVHENGTSQNIMKDKATQKSVVACLAHLIKTGEKLAHENQKGLTTEPETKEVKVETATEMSAKEKKNKELFEAGAAANMKQGGREERHQAQSPCQSSW
jgi:hypothetical protein